MGKTILIVDDSASMRQVVGMALKGSDYVVIEACDGKDALAKLAGQKIHLVISDVNMPNMDGITFVKTLKSDAKYAAMKFVPVIMLTSRDQTLIRKAAEGLHVHAFMTKPFSPNTLLQTIKDVVGDAPP